ncbi:MAG: hypothetical protein ACREJU_15015 [Nitrospiraceae bacterium]
MAHLLGTQPALSAEEKQPTQAPTVPNEGDRKKEAEELKRLQDVYLRNVTVFIRRGEVILELNTFYSTDRRQDFLPLSPTEATIIKTTRRFFDTSLFARIGLAAGLELDVRVPGFVHAEQEIELGTSRSRTVAEGLGDISGALRYQLWYERGSRPTVILDVLGKSRTGGDSLRGTGAYFVGGGITLLKTLDPVVFFGRVGYIETLPYNDRNLGSIIEYSIGMGYSLNDRVSFNMQLTNALIGRTTLLGQKIEGSSLELVNLLFTTTVLITKQLFIEPVVGIGVTDDAFDAILGLRLPYRF